MTIRGKNGGFTLIELMIASTVFAIVLLLISSGIIQIGNRYYKTTLQSRTQTAARNIVDEISRGMQFSGITPSNVPSSTPGDMSGQQGFCVNNIQYNFLYQTTTTSSGPNNRTFVASPQVGSCNNNAPSSAPANARNLLAPGMRLQKFEFNFDTTNRIAEIRLRVLTTPESGFDDVITSLTDPNATCTGSSSHLCAVSELSTVVQKRVQ